MRVQRIQLLMYYRQSSSRRFPIRKISLSGARISRAFVRRTSAECTRRIRVESVRFPVARGISAPLVPGYNRAFFTQNWNSSPHCTPESRDLIAMFTPISLSTAIYDEASWLLANKQLPRAENVRVEDFLAHLPKWFALSRAWHREYAFG